MRRSKGMFKVEMTPKLFGLQGQFQGHPLAKVKKMQITQARMVQFGQSLYKLVSLHKGYLHGEDNQEISYP
jgi:hypothetical protein